MDENAGSRHHRRQAAFRSLLESKLVSHALGNLSSAAVLLGYYPPEDVSSNQMLSMDSEASTIQLLVAKGIQPDHGASVDLYHMKAPIPKKGQQEGSRKSACFLNSRRVDDTDVDRSKELFDEIVLPTTEYIVSKMATGAVVVACGVVVAEETFRQLSKALQASDGWQLERIEAHVAHGGVERAEGQSFTSGIVEAEAIVVFNLTKDIYSICYVVHHMCTTSLPGSSFSRFQHAFVQDAVVDMYTWMVTDDRQAGDARLFIKQASAGSQFDAAPLYIVLRMDVKREANRAVL